MYEYKIFESDSLINEEQLNELSASGWQLVQIIRENDKLYTYMQRQRVQ